MAVRSLPQNRLGRRAVCAAALLLFTPRAAFAETVRISVAEFPDPVSTPSLVEALKIAYAKVPGVTVEITTAPFPRSMSSVANGSADLHIPIIRPPHGEDPSWSPTTATMYRIPWVLYTNKDKPVDLHNLGKLKIETDIMHVTYFDFPAVGSAGVGSSLQKVAAGRIDGFIYAANVADAILQELGLKNIHRDLIKVFDVSGVLPKGGRGGPTDLGFSKAMAAVEDDAAYKAAIQKALSAYKGPDWQP